MTTTANVTDASFADEVLASDLPVLVDFWADGCPPCDLIAPIIDELAAEYEGRVRFVKLDIDANPETTRGYGIVSMPTLGLFRKGELVSEIIGIQPRSALRAHIDGALDSGAPEPGSAES